MDDKGFFPLGLGDVHGSDRSLVRNGYADAANVGLLSGKSHTGPRIDAVLDHLKAIIEEKIAEAGGPPAPPLVLTGKSNATISQPIL